MHYSTHSKGLEIAEQFSLVPLARHRPDTSVILDVLPVYWSDWP